MGKASSNKKVARAAGTGGGRTARGARPWGWYATMALVTLVGSLLIVTSRNDRQAANNPTKSAKPRPPSLPGQKAFAGDHWHAAYGIYACDAFLPPITSDQDPKGIHTHGDGVVHIHPFAKASSGRNATFGVFADSVGLKISETHVHVPGGKDFKNGTTCAEGKKGTLRVFLNGDEHKGNPRSIRLRDRDLLVIAFSAEGTKIPKTPPSAAQLDKLNDVKGSTGLTVPSSVPSSLPEGTVTTTATTAATTSPTTAKAATSSSSSP